MTKKTPEPSSPLQIVSAFTSRRTFDTDKLNAHQARLLRGSSVEPGFEPRILEPRSRELIN
ncbi:hypothetical protein AVEN_105180-1, partial [Araneus ventricosus]